MQEISLNPQKLAGQCSKLKCCLMYEYDTYADARRTIPRLREPLQTLDGEYFLVKIDPLAQTMTFSTSKGAMVNLTTLSINRVKEIIALNRAGQKAETLLGEEGAEVVAEPTYRHEEDSITRFDNKSKRSKRSKRRGGKEDKQGKPSEEQTTQPANSESAPEADAEPKHEGRENRENREGRERRGHRHERRSEHAEKQEAKPQEVTPTTEGEGKEQREGRDHQHNNRRRGRGHHRPHRGERRAEGGEAQRHDNPKTE
jgi:hypothetical protein